MLPTILARQLQQGLRDYAETTFPTTNAPFRGSIKKMAETPGGLFLPPFLAARLPFRVDDGDKARFFQGFELDRQPYAHQRRAYERLGGDDPRPTLIATGTGSGKTECFMHPILDYCYRHRNETGVKAIVIYPMNALASDQARRFAQTIARYENLRDLRVGMYVGVGRSGFEPAFDGQNEKASLNAKREAAKVMGKDSVITDRETLLKNPPDVLLTNYKMLDYLLDRPTDAEIWKNNRTIPQPLRFLVVDELHTFDGAQGTDLACLIRRLKHCLRLGSGELCCVGSSATLGGESDVAAILDYASHVFNVRFDPDAIIGEDRLSAAEFFPPAEERLPAPALRRSDFLELASMTSTSSPGEYLAAAARAWLELDYDALATLRAAGDAPGDRRPEFAAVRVALGNDLKRSPVFRDLVASLDGKYRSTADLAETLARLYPRLFKSAPGAPDAPDEFAPEPDADPSAAARKRSSEEARLRGACVDSLFALASFARAQDPTGAIRPFVDVRVQLWFRELRRLVAKVVSEDDKDKFAYALSDELNAQDAKSWLPAINCRECGATGWAGVVSPKGTVENSLQEFYNLFFKGDDRVRYFFPWSEKNELPDSSPFARAEICPKCMRVDDAPQGVGSQGGEEKERVCAHCGEKTVSVIFPTLKSEEVPGTPKSECPFCESRNSLALVGLRCATETSATLSQLFASRFNDDKKTLAFSDSVQDAAHRAGFFTARARRFTLRGAIQRFANSLDKELSLEKFSEHFVTYWVEKLSRPSITDGLEREIHAQLDFIGTFIPRGMTFNRDYENVFRKARDPEFAKTLRDDGAFKKSLDRLWSGICKRMRYEILLEYGVRNRVGRTLRKTRSSCLVFPAEKIVEAAKEIVARAQIETPDLDLDEKAAQRIVVGVLDLMVRNGAIFDLAFDDYLRHAGKTYMLTQAHSAKDWWLPGRTAQNTPRFLVEKPIYGSRLFDPITRGKYWDWIRACVDVEMKDAGAFPKIVLDALVKQELIERNDESADAIYYVDRQTVKVTNKVDALRCDCGVEAIFGRENAGFWRDAPCPRRQCKKKLRPEKEDEKAGENYYRRLYAEGDVARIVARDHTGLLERESRETLEADFKRPDLSQTSAETRSEARRPWDPNVLSCTPTLEMGVDIGDLSTVELCGVPQTPAQFQQRIGRAGRRDGNSLALTVATVRPRDLFYYADPSDMIEGAARPPKIFLDAPAVLQRQLIAHCLDEWIVEKRGEVEIPRTLKELLNAYKKYASKELSLVAPFPFNFLFYTQNNQRRLLDSFFGLFANDNLSQATKDSLERFISVERGDVLSPMGLRFLGELAAQQSIIESLEKRRDMIQEQIAHFKSLPKDPSFDKRIGELTMEKSAVRRAIEDSNAKVVYNFMTDEALLPNYAFPEEGVVLKAILFRKDDRDETTGKKKKPNKTPYEYARSAASAISEFAPSSHFYVDGRKLQINQVDLGSAERALWRMCPNCSHMEQEDTTKPVAGACPRCGDLGWSDLGQVKTLLKARVVCSNMDESDCVIGDESDDRTSTFYFKQLLVETEREGQAYAIETPNFPFVFQYVEKATLREVNFGESGVLGEKTTVDGVSYARSGFTICGECGFVQGLQGKKRLHAGYCSQSSLYSHKDGKKPVKPEECFFLFREFSSEALRILIPASATKGCEKEGESFAAAFLLGLTEYFGNIDHLRASIVSEPDAKSGARRQALVLYDSVPGGTGYLNQFVSNPGAIRDVLRKALERLKSCSCANDPEKDGCFRCLLAYRQGGRASSVSRATAIRQISEILNGEELKEVDWGGVDLRRMYESELERLFIACLSNLGGKGRKVDVVNSVVKGRPGFTVTITDAPKDGKGAEQVGVWDVLQQVEINSLTDGISPSSRPDFVFYPRAFYPAEKGGVDPAKEHKPIAIFTDGFMWHDAIVGEDSEKRGAIHLSGKYRVFSISYNDVRVALGYEEPKGTPTLDVLQTPNAAYFQKFLNKLETPSVVPKDSIGDAFNKPANLQLLIDYMSRRDAETVYQKNAAAFAFATLEPKKKDDSAAFAAWRESADYAYAPFGLGANSHFDFGERGLFGAWRPLGKSGFVTLYSGWTFSKEAAESAPRVDVAAVLADSLEARQNPLYRDEWHGFWRLANFLQFSPTFVFASTVGIREEKYWTLPRPTDARPDDSLDANAAAWKENVFDALFPEDEETSNFAKTCVAKGVPAPDMVGEDLSWDDLGGKGSDVAATVDLGWRDRKVAFLSTALKDFVGVLRDAGWIVLTSPADLDSAPF